MNYKKIFLILTSLVILSLSFSALSMAQDSNPVVYTLKVEGTVTAGTAKHIGRGIKTAGSEGAEAVVVMLNTPGGLVTATLDIIQSMSASAVPVITYVSPQGAIAASAGTFILLDGHIAAMSPGTTCGAAMPVNLTAPGEQSRAADQKTINFLAGHIKSIARERGRPVDLAEKFVTENLSLDNSEALNKGVVDLNAANLEDLLRKVDGMEVRIDGRTRSLNTSGAQVQDLPLNTNERFTHIVSDPTISMILLLLGIYGLVIGFYSPGIFLPEVLGSVSLILGLTGMGLFQGNLGAGLLILLGVGLLIAEVFTPTYGLFGVGGLVSIVMGILFFPIEPLMPAGWFIAFKLMALGVGVIGAVLVVIVVASLARIRRLEPVHGEAEFRDAAAYVVKELNPEGLVRFRGETWRAVAKDGATISHGQRVKIVERQGITLIVCSSPQAEKN